MKKLIFVTMLLISMLPLLASLAFDEPVPLYDFANYSLGTLNTTSSSGVCPNGNQVTLFVQSKQGIRNTYMQIYSPENQALLAEPILIGHRWLNDYRLVMNPDNSIAVGRRNSGDPKSFILDTYDQTGSLISQRSNICVYNGRSDRCYLLSDGLGGLHFGAKHNYQGYYYQHVDALGNLAHPLPGLYIEGYSELYFQMIATEDHGALLSIPTRINYVEGVKFVKISAEHQIAGEFTIPGIEQFPAKLSFISADLNSFYAVWESSAHLAFANKINYAGECLWTQAWTPADGSARYPDAVLVNSEGNLIVYYYLVSGQHYTSHFDVINPSGSIMHSQLTSPHEPTLEYSYYHHYPVADNAGGWFLTCVTEYPYTEPQNFVQHFTHDYTSWSSVVPLADDILDAGLNTVSVQLQGNNLQLLYQNNQDNQSGIYSQIIDSQGNVSYPYPGQSLLVGSHDNAFDVKSIALPGGSCLSMWRQGETHETYRAHKLMYNIISPRGNSLFPAAQCLLENAAYVSNYEAFPLGDSQVLIAWTIFYDEQYTSRAQVLNMSGEVAWEPEGRLLYSGAGRRTFSLWDDALYMARSTTLEIRLHRFVNGIASWPQEGILAAVQNPGWPSSFLRVEALTGNRLFWSQSVQDVCPEMSFLNIIDAAGNLQYPVEGLPLADLGREYLGLSLSHCFWQGDTQIYVMKYWYGSMESDGHSHQPYWVWYNHHKFQAINPDGSLGAAPSAEQNVGSRINCSSEDAYYTAHGTTSINIRKFDLSGNELWNVPFSHNSYLTNMCALPDGRVLLSSIRSDALINSTLCYYFLLDADGNIEIPADTQWGVGDISALIPTEYGSYMILVPYNNSHISSYGGVQYYEVTTWPNDDPQVSPPVQLLSQNFPNPFKEQTRICLKLDEAAPASLKVYNIRGQMVKTLCDGALPKGDSYLDWDGKDDKGNPCASGVYIFRAKANKKSKTIKVLKIQ